MSGAACMRGSPPDSRDHPSRNVCRPPTSVGKSPPRKWSMVDIAEQKMADDGDVFKGRGVLIFLSNRFLCPHCTYASTHIVADNGRRVKRDTTSILVHDTISGRRTVLSLSDSATFPIPQRSRFCNVASGLKPKENRPRLSPFVAPDHTHPS